MKECYNQQYDLVIVVRQMHGRSAKECKKSQKEKKTNIKDAMPTPDPKPQHPQETPKKKRQVKIKNNRK